MRVGASAHGYVVAIVILSVVAVRIHHHHSQRKAIAAKVLAKYSRDRSSRLQIAELSAWLSDNGVKASDEQVSLFRNLVDADKDGFSEDEVLSVAEVLKTIGNISSNLEEMGESIWEDMVDIEVYYPTGAVDWFVMLCLLAGISFLMFNSESLEERLSRAQNKIFELQETQKKLHRQEEKLESELERWNEQSSKVMKFKVELDVVQKKARNTDKQVQQQLRKIQEEAQRRLDEILEQHNRTFLKRRLTASLTSLANCVGSWRHVGSGNVENAQRGFVERPLDVGSLRATDPGSFVHQRSVFGHLPGAPGEPLRIYELQSKLGQGKDCAYACLDRISGKQVACKIYPKSGSELARELLGSTIPKHKHVVRYKTAVETDTQVFVIMERIQGKDLFDLQQINGGAFSEDYSLRIFAQLSQAIQHLHGNGVVHGDIKRENVMVTDQGEDVKLIDFGYASVHLGNAAPCVFKDDLEKEPFAPPELLVDHQEAQTRFDLQPNVCGRPSKEDDIWRLGVLLYMMLLDAAPFDPSTLSPDARKRGEFIAVPSDANISSGARNLINSLLTAKPANRPQIERVIDLVQTCRASASVVGRQRNPPENGESLVVKRRRRNP